jgi:hypothetical protein
MKTLVRLLLLLVLGFGIWWFFLRSKSDSGPKQQPLAVLKHSQKFNQGINDVMDSYFAMQAAFINADSVLAGKQAEVFITKLDSVDLNELSKDTSAIQQSVQILISDLKANATALMAEPNITEMRKDYRMISENLYPLLKTISYEGPVLYWQNCGMPFGEGTSANWISKTHGIMNPYLGQKHPVYKSGMLHCGEVQDSIFAK